jgi:ferric-dicitrate binding protein FerR (iron transport regulator)
VQLRLHEALPKEVLMQPGQLVDYSSRQGNLVQKSVNPQPFVAWKQEHWVLNNHTLREIAILTEETYGLKVSFEDDSLQDLRLSGKIGTGDVTLLLEALSATHPVRYRLQNNQIILQRRP